MKLRSAAILLAGLLTTSNASAFDFTIANPGCFQNRFLQRPYPPYHGWNRPFYGWSSNYRPYYYTTQPYANTPWDYGPCGRESIAAQSAPPQYLNQYGSGIPPLTPTATSGTSVTPATGAVPMVPTPAYVPPVAPAIPTPAAPAIPTPAAPEIPPATAPVIPNLPRPA